MLGTKKLETLFVYAAAPATFTPLIDATTGENLLGLSFQVEEDEMFVELECRLSYSTPTPSLTYFTLYVDGVSVETGPGGILFADLTAGAGQLQTVQFRKIVQLTKGIHNAEVRLQNGAEPPAVDGGTVASELTVRRISHPATLGHGVESKRQLIQ